MQEVLCYIIKQHGYSKAKKLGYLNAFVKLLDRHPDKTSLGMSLKDVMKWYVSRNYRKSSNKNWDYPVIKLLV